MTRHFPAHLGDKAFFATFPERSFLARRYVGGDGPTPSSVSLFASDEAGNLVEVNLVIVKRLLGGRARLLFATSRGPLPNNDREIAAFLRMRNIDPLTLRKLSAS